MATPTPMPPTTQNFRTPQPSPIGDVFMGVFEGVYESSGSSGLIDRSIRRTEPSARRTGCTGRINRRTRPTSDRQEAPADQWSERTLGLGSG
ncbi:hypothetical protein GCM10015535_45170 [Streptomyces gelaticus]|uniref:Uncharacterized protein n=1 Tax=Streptomyces gelaticus TaxID=285446 RepID=A0ABQ2W5A9_9ACTN|nr:hypothetical protein GCM10015535_45170 [Streptomyces gelaticus]